MNTLENVTLFNVASAVGHVAMDIDVSSWHHKNKFCQFFASIDVRLLSFSQIHAARFRGCSETRSTDWIITQSKESRRKSRSIANVLSSATFPALLSLGTSRQYQRQWRETNQPHLNQNFPKSTIHGDQRRSRRIFFSTVTGFVPKVKVSAFARCYLSTFRRSASNSSSGTARGTKT